MTENDSVGLQDSIVDRASAHLELFILSALLGLEPALC